jgi:hypothetical protein
MSGRSANLSDTELSERLTRITEELKALHRDLYWLAESDDVSDQTKNLENLNLEQMIALKLAVDNARELIWKYVDALSQIEPQRVEDALEAHHSGRVTQLLQLLRERLGPSSEQPAVSFIERVSAAIEDKLTGGDKAA